MSDFYDDTVDASDWLLFYMECPIVSNGRGLVSGKIYKRDGTLAVACVSLVARTRSTELTFQLPTDTRGSLQGSDAQG